MTSNLRWLAVILLAVFLNGCASIFSSSIYPVTINSSPAGANVKILDDRGKEVFNGRTPATASLKSSNGFFKKADYQVQFTLDGYDSVTMPVSSTIDGWYFGNLLLGGIVGMLIVDPATGAMFKLEDEFLNVTLAQSNSGTTTPGLKVYDLAEIPSGWRGHLVKISK